MPKVYVKFFAFPLLMVSFNVTAVGLPVKPLVKEGSCPTGYITSGNYCAPAQSARFAVKKTGSCPSGYTTSGNYCLAGGHAKFAIVKVGSCPSGYLTSGNYCLSGK